MSLDDSPCALTTLIYLQTSVPRRGVRTPVPRTVGDVPDCPGRGAGGKFGEGKPGFSNLPSPKTPFAPFPELSGTSLTVLGTGVLTPPLRTLSRIKMTNLFVIVIQVSSGRRTCGQQLGKCDSTTLFEFINKPGPTHSLPRRPRFIATCTDSSNLKAGTITTVIIFILIIISTAISIIIIINDSASPSSSSSSWSSSFYTQAWSLWSTHLAPTNFSLNLQFWGELSAGQQHNHVMPKNMPKNILSQTILSYDEKCFVLVLIKMFRSRKNHYVIDVSCADPCHL